MRCLAGRQADDILCVRVRQRCMRDERVSTASLLHSHIEQGSRDRCVACRVGGVGVRGGERLYTSRQRYNVGVAWTSQSLFMPGFLNVGHGLFYILLLYRECG